MKLRQLLARHLRESRETYWQHLAFTVWMGVNLIALGFLLLVHGLLPFLLTRTVSERLYYIVDDFEERALRRRGPR